jgi:ribosomal protein S18 acetylase RimI-like enzyme
LNIEILSHSSPLWESVADYADACSWSAGKALARDMQNGAFTDWERVIAALDEGRVCGYCTATKTDCIPDMPYTPYIGFVFVDEAYRGNRLSQKLIQSAMAYLKSVGFDRVYLTSDHENLYEKYGFTVIDRKTAFWGAEEKIYFQKL